jgi:hypothetical protein
VKIVVDVRGQTGSDSLRQYGEQRHSPRYPFEVEVRIYPRNSPVVRGHSVDISESGLAVILRLDLPPGEMVRVEFKVPHGEVEVWAVVKQRTAFRHGLQFLDSGPAKELIHRTCRQLAMEAAANSARNR